MKQSKLKEVISNFPQGIDPEIDIEFKHLNGYDGDTFQWISDYSGKGIGFDIKIEINETGIATGKMIIKASDVPEDWTEKKQKEVDDARRKLWAQVKINTDNESNTDNNVI